MCLTVCAPHPEKTCLKVLSCPTCGKRRRMLAEFYEWYGWFLTCLTCGEQWEDGEQLERPFCRGWRKESVRKALERLAMAHRWPELGEK